MFDETYLVVQFMCGDCLDKVQLLEDAASSRGDQCVYMKNLALG